MKGIVVIGRHTHALEDHSTIRAADLSINRTCQALTDQPRFSMVLTQ
jgi:hypothetical protein